MSLSADSVRSDVIAILQILQKRKIEGDVDIRTEAGHNAAVIASIRFYKQSHPNLPTNFTTKKFDTIFSENDLLWFMKQFKYDGKGTDKEDNTTLTPSQRNKVLYTLFRYWSIA